MALGKYADRVFVRGPGNLQLLEKSPSAGTEFVHAGWLKSSEIDQSSEMVDHIVEQGFSVGWDEKTRTVLFSTILMQSGIDEINLPKLASGKVYGARYFGEVVRGGPFQYFIFDRLQLKPGVVIPFGKGERGIPITARASKDGSLAFDVPEWTALQTAGEIAIDNLHLWLEPRIGLNSGSDRLLDVSGWSRHGQFSADYSSIWQTGTTPERFLRFDGANDQLNLGNILNDDASGDFVIVLWLKFPTGGAQEEILCKKSLVGDNTAGWALHKTASNTIAFKLASGSANATATSTGTVLTAWKQAAVTVDRNGNIQVYLDGVASGSPATVSAIGTGTNAGNLYLGRDGTNFGQFDGGGLKVYRYLAGGLPSNIASLIAAQYAAERAFFNV